MDSRDPEFFRCEDLEKYVKETAAWKENFLLINKADLLSEELRNIWSNYFNSKSINHVFFSAKAEQAVIDETPTVQAEKGSILTALQPNDEVAEKMEKGSENDGKVAENTAKVLNRADLLKLMKQRQEIILQKRPKDALTARNKRKGLVTIGMVGYPNVGKSSVINVIFGKKRVGVGAMPGKTKHF